MGASETVCVHVWCIRQEYTGKWVRANSFNFAATSCLTISALCCDRSARILYCIVNIRSSRALSLLAHNSPVPVPYLLYDTLAYMYICLQSRCGAYCVSVYREKCICLFLAGFVLLVAAGLHLHARKTSHARFLSHSHVGKLFCSQLNVDLIYNFQSHERNAPICNGTHFRTRPESIRVASERVRGIFINPAGFWKYTNC